MQFLTSAQTQVELQELRQLLRDKGVPTLLQEDLAPYSKAMLYVLIDSQYNDAFQLMQNASYKVAKPIDQETIEAMEAEIKTDSSILWGSFKPYAIGVLFVLFIATVFLIGYVS